MKIRVNEKSLSAKVEKSLVKKYDQLQNKLYDIAEDIGSRAIVDTGAYAESWSVVPSSSGGGRSVSSKGRPRGQSVGAYQGVAIANMRGDISSLDLKKLSGYSVSFRNRAPHAGYIRQKGTGMTMREFNLEPVKARHK